MPDTTHAPVAGPPKRGRGRPPGSPNKPKPVDPTPTALSREDMGSEGLANLKDAAKFLGGVHANTVRNLISRGKLPMRKVGKLTMVPWAALRAYAGVATAKS